MIYARIHTRHVIIFPITLITETATPMSHADISLRDAAVIIFSELVTRVFIYSRLQISAFTPWILHTNDIASRHAAAMPLDDY